MPDADHEAVADEQMHLPELDLVRVGAVPGRSEHQEERVAVPLELGALVALPGVLDGVLVQVELTRDGGELGIVRTEQSDPGEVAPGVGRQGRRTADATSSDVDGVVDECHVVLLECREQAGARPGRAGTGVHAPGRPGGAGAYVSERAGRRPRRSSGPIEDGHPTSRLTCPSGSSCWSVRAGRTEATRRDRGATLPRSGRDHQRGVVTCPRRPGSMRRPRRHRHRGPRPRRPCRTRDRRRRSARRRRRATR